ncbi:hypothetical protein ACQKGI_21505 [Peribacillus muralis]|uniref:hypothetical protein n=1 Tax=Peribacillus muralis TaxID=264697 RepID=UPI00382F3830
MITFKEGILAQYMENRAERTLLRKTIFNSGFLGHISDSVCMELERVGKYIYRSFLQQAASSSISADIREELLKLARFVYTHSLRKLALALPANKQLLQAPKQASAYLSKIIYNETLEQMAKYAHQAESIKSLLDREPFHREISEKALGRKVNAREVTEHIEPILLKHHQAEFIRSVLNDWCEKWLISRVKKGPEEGRKVTNEDRQTASDYMTSIRNDTYGELDKLMATIRKYGSHAIAPADRNATLANKKASLQAFFAIQKERLAPLPLTSC